MNPIPSSNSLRLRLLCATGSLILLLPLLLPAHNAQAAGTEPPSISVVNDAEGSRLEVDGQDFMVFGMNWGYLPIGQNYSYDFWGQPDDFIVAVLAREMPLLKSMGVNTIRQAPGMQPRWIEYMWRNYGIYTILNDTVGRYGVTIDGVWYPTTDYSDPKVRAFLKDQIAQMVERYKGTPGLLMWLLGNENNYGLSWSSFEIEALPKGEQNAARAQFLYSLFGEIIQDIKKRDPHHPVAIANGDVQYIDIVAKECKGLDVFGSNVYRGVSARDFFQVVHDKLGIPALFTEFGADAFNAITMKEDQASQAYYLLGQWEEIYEQSAGKGRANNAIGGLIFQWSDGWWKFGQDSRLDIHDTNASWPNAGYPTDYREGDNNMNEEWWGITAKGFPNPQGFYEVYPRAAYYALRDAFTLDPYASSTDLETIRKHFAKIEPMAEVLKARGDAASYEADLLKKVRVSGLRMEFETYSTGGKNISTPKSENPQDSYPSFLGFDHGESFFAQIEAKPNEGVIGRLSLNVLGNVPQNPINEIFYENRGRPQTFLDENGNPVEVQSLERVKVYQADLSWDDRWFKLDSFYRTGHLHWQYEGDFFGLYRDAFYGENLDIYNGEAPIGFEIAGKKFFNGFKLAMGPQLWWGANPAVFLKYDRNLAGIEWTGIYQEDFSQRTQATSSIAIPIRSTRKASLQMQTGLGPFGFEGGLLWSGQPRVGESFQLVDESIVDAGGPVAPGDVRQDKIKSEDTWGFKGKLSWEHGRWHWYGEGAYMGLVAEAGPTAIPTFTGWDLRDSGMGNQVNALSGVAITMGNWQIGPNFLWQKPIVGPMPNSSDLAGTAGRPRNVLDDPFAVRANRETTAGELMITYDPTPATWMWSWDNDLREDANFAASLGFSLKRHHTTADAGLFISADNTILAFPGATPARDLWELHGRMIHRLSPRARMISHFYYGTAEPNGDNPRLVHRAGVDSRIVWPSVALSGFVKVHDYGPYDYHHDHNLTFPLQLMADVSFTLGTPRWFDLPQTRIGVQGTFRTLNRYSNRYQPQGATAPTEGTLYPEGLPLGREWEIRTYVQLAI